MLSNVLFKFRGETKISSEPIYAAVVSLAHDRLLGLAQLDGQFDQRSQLRRLSGQNVERLITLRTLAVAVCCWRGFAQFVKQPRILDGDDGLGREEIIEKRNLFVGKWPSCLTVDNNGADEHVVLEHGHANDGARPTVLRRVARNKFTAASAV